MRLLIKNTKENIKEVMDELNQISPIQLRADTIDQLQSLIERGHNYWKTQTNGNRRWELYIFYNIIKNHYLIDGNKRTAVWIYSSLNHKYYPLFKDVDKAVEFIKSVAASDKKFEDYDEEEFWDVFDYTFWETAMREDSHLIDVVKALEKE